MTRAFAIIAISAMLLSSCGASFDRQRAVNGLVADGIERSVADCIVDQMIDELGEDQLAENRALTPDEMTIRLEAEASCVQRDAIVEIIMETAPERAVAECIFDTAVGEFGIDAVVGAVSQTPEQAERLGVIVQECARR